MISKIFCMVILIKGASISGCTFCWVWPGCLLSNQFAGFSDQQYLWKKSIDILYFLGGYIQQVRYHVTLPHFIARGQVCLWFNQVPGFFNHLYLWKETIYTLAWPLPTYSSFLFVLLHLLPNLAGVYLVIICFFPFLDVCVCFSFFLFVTS